MRDKFHEALEKYELTIPIEEKMQDEFVRRKKTLLVKILKKKGKYGLFLPAILAIYYFFRERGRKITIAQSKALFAVFLFFVFAGLAVGSYFLFRPQTTGKVIGITEKKIETFSRKLKATSIPLDKKEKKPIIIKRKTLFFEIESSTIPRNEIRRIKEDLEKKYGYTTNQKFKIKLIAEYFKEEEEYALYGTVLDNNPLQSISKIIFKDKRRVKSKKEFYNSFFSMTEKFIKTVKK